MSTISIIMPCFNSDKFLAIAIDSVINQSFEDWELIIVNDGSTDQSLSIALSYSDLKNRIRVVSKENGGYVSARLMGLNYISQNSKYLLFFDSDDVLHYDMLFKFYTLMEKMSEVGAIYCNHALIDVEGRSLGLPKYGARIIPTLLGVKNVHEDFPFTHFVSIFCWATKMLEPLTMIRREAYFESSGWDPRFGKGQGNIGDGVLLFAEIALKWKIYYLSEPLYFYRKHQQQATAIDELNKLAALKVLDIWKEKLKNEFYNNKDIKAAIICFKYRFKVYYQLGTIKYNLRYHPLYSIKLIFKILLNYLMSLQLVFYKKTKIFK